MGVLVQPNEPLPNENQPPRPQPLVQIDEPKICSLLDEMVRSTGEETLNKLLDTEAETHCGEKRHKRTLHVQ